jgi:hypothetical protein
MHAVSLYHNMAADCATMWALTSEPETNCHA